MLKQIIQALLVTGITALISWGAHADTIYSLVKPSPALKATEAKKLPEFYKCFRVKTGKNIAPVKASDAVFVAKAPADDATAFDSIDDKTKKVYKCELSEFDHDAKKIRKIKDS